MARIIKMYHSLHKAHKHTHTHTYDSTDVPLSLFTPLEKLGTDKLPVITNITTNSIERSCSGQVSCLSACYRIPPALCGGFILCSQL